VAVRLQNGLGVEQIHPIVIKMPGNEACVPLRLTGIAAIEDMTVRLLFLADQRAVPTNDKHVALNPLRLDWLKFASDYDDAVSKAVDSPLVDGHGFVTGYAGTSKVAAMSMPPWSAAAFQTLAPEKVVDELQKQGLGTCATGPACKWSHPLVPDILRQFLLAPAGLEEGAFWSALPEYASMIDLDAWDPLAFTGAFDERILVPARHAVSVLDDHPYLMWMVTKISPTEMTSDPEFTLRTGLPDVAPLRRGAIAQCSCPVMSIPDDSGGTLSVKVSAGWPQWTEDMPYAERVEDYSTGGHRRPQRSCDGDAGSPVDLQRGRLLRPER
jgi:hypothetical protein